MKVLDFEFNYSDHKVLDHTIHAHVTVMDAYTRRYGKLTVIVQKAMAAQIEK